MEQNKSVLAALEPSRVFHYFEQLCGIPHGSGNVKAAADWLADFAVSHGLAYERDEAENVVIRKPASPGYEDAPAVILQGHTDMVCAKREDSPHDFLREGLMLLTDGETVRADGTTLGADDGIAVAMALAILEDPAAEHPALEAVFTSDEEIGLLGAKAFDCSKLQGRLLLNMDSEDEGVLTVSCAGGATVRLTLPVSRAACDGEVYTVEISGLTGGHSGAEIHKGRANAAVLAGELLRESGGGLVSIEGGSADNAIMPACKLTLCGEGIPEAARTCEERFRASYPEEDIRVTATPAGRTGAEALTLPLGDFLARAPYGVQAMSKEIDGLVQTSLNLGILRTEPDALVMTYSVRSSVEKEKDALCETLIALAKEFGGSAEISGAYPAWEYRKESPLREHLCATFARLYGRPMRVEAIHAGLECGLFAGGIPDLDAVSFGPDMRAIHTPEESLSVASVARTFAYLREVLRGLRRGD
ncbi:MAG: aminoacyl-histidine dipeptidase [Oscillospiraceae bacterium]|nr:aminoacyl-histidine dipeptidase [Oscillospiraceae bacterium]